MNTRTSRAIANRLHQSVAPAVGPFDDTPDAVAAEVVIRKPFVRTQKAEVGLFDDSSGKKKKTDFNSKQRDWFDRHGWKYARVEQTNAFGSCSVDMWGFVDYLACHPEHGALLVQTCALTDISTRANKAEGLEIKGSKDTAEKRAERRAYLVHWLQSGGKFEVHGWSKPANRWVVKRVRLVLEGGELKREVIGAEEGAKG